MSNPYGTARLACFQCRRMKRKCTRERPICELCRRAHRRCQYPPEELDYAPGDPAGIAASGASVAIQAMAASIVASVAAATTGAALGATPAAPAPAAPAPAARESVAPAATVVTTAAPADHPTATAITSAWAAMELPPRRRDPATSLFFLDSFFFGLSRTTIERPSIELPPESLLLLTDETALRNDLAVYLARVHPTFPIVSKLRLRLELASPNRQPDTLFLLLAIRLICRSIDPEPNPDTIALYYSHAKRFSAYLDAAGLMSLRRLQASLLLAHHEIAQAIFPAAYMTVGACARLGQMMGIHSRYEAVRVPPLRMSLVECEESDRLWWATLILDRYINIGLDDRPFACRDAKPDERLPMNETSWETGESAVRPSLAITSEAFVAAPPFARTCQAAHLLTRVLHHVNNSNLANHEEYTAFYHEALQLNRILEAFNAALWQELLEAVATSTTTTPDAHPPGHLAIALFPAFALSLSAHLSFYDSHTCIEVDHPRAAGLALQLEMQTTALEGAKALIGKIAVFSQLVSKALARTVDDNATPIVSPLVANSLYQASKNLFLYYQETGRSDLLDVLEKIKLPLREMGKLWPIADQYLAILDLDCLRTTA